MTAGRSPARRRRRSTPPPRQRAPSRRKRSRLWLWLGSVALLPLAAVVALLVWATRPGPGEGERVAVQFSGQEPPGALGDELEALGLIDRPGLFELYSRLLAPQVRVSPGPHLLERGLSPRRLLQYLGRLPSRPTAKLVIPEGYTHFQIAERLERQGICTAAAFRAAVQASPLLERLGISGASAEGYLFPATYQFYVDADPELLVTQLVRETRRRLERLDRTTGGGLSRLRTTRGWSERDVLTLASIVERESAVPDERARIASVFFNRLDDPEFRPARRLQSDPTAAYGCLIAGETIPSCAGFGGRITPEMLRDAANPYNTYRHPGLPPGPIANPGEGAVLAVLRPEATGYLYFVLGPDGRHRFGRSFEEHRRAIDRKGPSALSPSETKR